MRIEIIDIKLNFIIIQIEISRIKILIFKKTRIKKI